MRNTTKRQAPIKTDQLERASEILRALAHTLRMRILAFIDKHGSIHVNKIYNTLKLEQSITSQHLRILRQAGLVHTRRDGKFIFYSINYEKMGESVDAIRNYLEEIEE